MCDTLTKTQTDIQVRSTQPSRHRATLTHTVANNDGPDTHRPDSDLENWMSDTGRRHTHADSLRRDSCSQDGYICCMGDVQTHTHTHTQILTQKKAIQVRARTHINEITKSARYLEARETDLNL